MRAVVRISGPVVLALATTLGRPGTARAAEAACTAERAGPRAFVQVALADPFDPDLLRLVRLGLRGHVVVDLALLRPRRLWWAERLHEATRTLEVAWSEEAGRFLVDGAAVESLARLRLAPIALRPPGAPLPATPLRVDVNVRVEVVTSESLGRVAGWMLKGDEAGAPRSTISEAVLRTIARDLQRQIAGGCAVPTEVPPPAPAGGAAAPTGGAVGP